jgi:hypothetical protein
MKSQHARAAQMIKQELKTIFPTTTFSVKSRSYAGGDSVDIEWDNGPTTEQVNEISKKYQYGHFDGMIDLYEISNNREDIPQSKFVMTRRNITDDIKLQACKVFAEHYGACTKIKLPTIVEEMSAAIPNFSDRWVTWHDLCYQVLCHIDLTGAIGIKEDKNWNGGSLWSGFIPLLKGDEDGLREVRLYLNEVSK